MKNSLIVVGLVVSVLCVGGCVVFVSEETRGHRGGSDATIAEIDAVGKLSFDSERKKGYERIAAGLVCFCERASQPEEFELLDR